MSVFVPAPDVMKVELCYTQSDQQTENVFHVKKDGGSIDEADLAVIAEYFKDWWIGGPKLRVGSYCTLRMIRVTDLTTRTSPGIEYTTGLPSSGDVVGKALPNNVTAVVKWTTGVRGRSYRGRTYITGLTTDDASASSLQSSARAVYEGYFFNLMDDMPLGFSLVICSYFNEGSPRTTAVSTPVTGVSIDAYVDSQRRRLIGRGA